MSLRKVAIAVLILGVLAAPIPSFGQQPAKVHRIGALFASSPPAPPDTSPHQCPLQGGPYWQVFLEGLREHGYLPGQNLVIECRWTGGQAERAPPLAAELVSLKVDLLVAMGIIQVLAAKQATRTIPIVMLNVVDPVGRGLVASLAHPGGNVTGLTETVGMEIEGKRLQLLKEAAPTISRVAVLQYLYSGGPSGPNVFQQEEEAAARALGLTLQFYGVRAPTELRGAFAAMAKAQALYVPPDLHWSMGGYEQPVVALAAQSRLPAIYEWEGFVQAGGLMAYAVNHLAIRRRVGFYVDKILHGENPGDLPVEQPTKFDLLINLKAAKALGLTIPQSLLMRADEVIQ